MYYIHRITVTVYRSIFWVEIAKREFSLDSISQIYWESELSLLLLFSGQSLNFLPFILADNFYIGVMNKSAFIFH